MHVVYYLQLLKKVKNKNDVYCKEGNKDQYGRLIAICYANEMNLNSTMVKQGWAIACRYYSNDYINEEDNAKKIKEVYVVVVLYNRMFGEKIINC